jgi:nitrite reductase/ring-hydroxylating ferredoxin subunit
MPFERVCRLAELPPNSVLEATVRGEEYAICNVNGKISALYGICPHAGGPLGQGQIGGSGRLVCPYHMWEFDCVTGESEFDSAIRVPVYPVKLEGNDVLADLP